MEVEDVETCTRAVITVVDESFTLGSNRSHHRGPTATIVVISYVFSVRLRPVTSSATRVANGEKRGKRWYRAWRGGEAISCRSGSVVEYNERRGYLSFSDGRRGFYVRKNFFHVGETIFSTRLREKRRMVYIVNF